MRDSLPVSEGRRLQAGPLAGVAAGLYLARVGCEWGTSARNWPASALAAGAGVVAGLALALLLRRRRLATWPLLLPAAYLLWPRADLRLALAVGVVSAVSLALSLRRPRRLPPWLAEAGAGVASLGLYVATLAPSVQPADAGEFQLVAAVLGIAHPPGYPLYTLLGKGFTLLPLGDAAWRVNLLAAVCAAATLAVLVRAVRQATGSAAAGLLAALTLGLAPTYWAQGTFANIRSLTGLLAALCLHWLLAYGREREPRYLLAFAVTFGLAVTHHSSLALLGLPFLAYLLAVDPRLPLQPRRWARAAVGFGASFIVLLYLPLRSMMGPAFDTPSVRTLAGFVRHVLALGFQGDFLYFLTQPTLGLRFGVLADILRLEFGVALWVGALALGLLGPIGRAGEAGAGTGPTADEWPSAGRNRPRGSRLCSSADGLPAGRWRWVLLWGGVAVVNALAAITYRAPQTVEYLLPTYVALAYGLGLGLGRLLQARTAWPLPALAGGLVACLALGNGLQAYPSFRALHQDGSTREQAAELLQSAPENALILSGWHQATPLWYLQEVEGLRPDVTVTYVYPEGATPNGEVWARRIREAAGQRPVVVTNRFAEYAGLPYRLVAQGPGWRIEAAEGQGVPAGLSGTPELLGDAVEFLGVRLAGGAAAPGQAVEVEVAWRPQAAFDRDYSWFVHLVGPQGIAGQADLTYTPAQVAAGVPMLDGYRFPLRPDAPPGEYRLIAGVYVTFADGGWERLRTPAGEEAIALGMIRVHPRQEAPATAHPLDQAWADGSRLVGVDYDDSLPGTRRMYLHWYRPAGAADLEATVSAWRHPERVQIRVSGGDEAGYQSVSCDLSPEAALASLSLTAGGQPVAALGPWHRAVSAPGWTSTGPAAGARYLDLGGEMVLVGARWQPESPQANGQLRAELELIAQRPLLADYSLSLSLEGDGWRAQHDGTPALGAIPTLKWLRGWRVRDLRLLQVPAEAEGGAVLRLGVYDAFTLQLLPIGDDRLARLGQGMQAVLWEGEVQ